MEQALAQSAALRREAVEHVIRHSEAMLHTLRKGMSMSPGGKVGPRRTIPGETDNTSHDQATSTADSNCGGDRQGGGKRLDFPELLSVPARTRSART